MSDKKAPDPKKADPLAGFREKLKEHFGDNITIHEEGTVELPDGAPSVMVIGQIKTPMSQMDHDLVQFLKGIGGILFRSYMVEFALKWNFDHPDLEVPDETETEKVIETINKRVRDELKEIAGRYFGSDGPKFPKAETSTILARISLDALERAATAVRTQLVRFPKDEGGLL